MLHVDPQSVRFIMELAREFQAQDNVVSSDKGDDGDAALYGDWVTRLLANHRDDMGITEFRAAIEDLTHDQQQHLVALYWLGRNDFSRDEWPAAVAEARRNWNGHTAEYLISHPQLSEHLNDGLALLGYNEAT